MNAEQSLQQKSAPQNVCFGCGQANSDGLHIRSFPKNGEVVAQWKPEKKYEALDRSPERRDHRDVTGLSLQLDGSVSSDEARRRRSPALHGHCGIRNQIAATDSDERFSFSFCENFRDHG